MLMHSVQVSKLALSFFSFFFLLAIFAFNNGLTWSIMGVNTGGIRMFMWTAWFINLFWNSIVIHMTVFKYNNIVVDIIIFTLIGPNAFLTERRRNTHFGVFPWYGVWQMRSPYWMLKIIMENPCTSLLWCFCPCLLEFKPPNNINGMHDRDWKMVEK